MNKRVVIKIGPGSLETGYSAAVQIGPESAPPQVETQAHLPPAPELRGLYQQWQQSYWNLGSAYRIEITGGVTNVSDVSDIETCRALSRRLRDRIHHWLNGDAFRPIREKLLEQLSPSDTARVLLQTEDPFLQRLPWYELQFFDRYRKAEVGICSLNYQQISHPGSRTSKVRILAVFGDSTGLNTQVDESLLNNLRQLDADVDIHFLSQPSREVFNRCLWDEKGWDILFFAGHSSSALEPGRGACQSGSGEMLLNPTEKLTIPQLKHALKKAIERGLNTAIFNSCDGLGLAADLADLYIPQVLVMREPVPDVVAHAFLQGFLESFAAGNLFYVAVREAREKMQGLEARFPCATWLPVIVQNLAEVPPTWLSLQGQADATTVPKRRKEDFLYPNGKLGTPLKVPLQNTLEKDLFSEAGSAERKSRLPRWKVGVGSGVVAAIALIFMRQFGFMAGIESNAYDLFNRTKPTEAIDNRLLIITNTDADISKYPSPDGSTASVSEGTLLALLNKLTPLNPALVGLDIYRPFAAKNAELAEKLKTTQNLVTICKSEDPTTAASAEPPAPEIIAAKDTLPGRLGASDFVYADDPGSIVRRHLLFFASRPPCQTGEVVTTTFSTQLALRYLQEKHQVELSADKNRQDGLQLGSTIWPLILEESFGGYHKLDTQGDQILLNYRRLRDAKQQTGCGVIESPADCLTVSKALELSSDDLRGYVANRIVLIGTTAISRPEDKWVTPFTPTASVEDQVAGVFLQAQMTSQLISAELDSPPRLLYTAWPEWKEIVWIMAWAIAGGLICAYSRRGKGQLWLQIITGEGLLLLVCWLWLVKGGVWVPWVPVAIAFPVAAIATDVLQRQMPSSYERKS